jgi:Tfp pilus assembly protein PilF
VSWPGTNATFPSRDPSIPFRGVGCEGAVLVPFLLLSLVLAACTHAPDPNALAQHRNLGKAFYENPTTKAEAVKEFKAALDLNPHSNREKLNYALALLRSQGRESEAIQLLDAVQREEPSLPHTWFNLGIYDKRAGKTKDAIAQFEGMLQRTPNEAVAHFQLGTLYRQTGRTAGALTQFETAAKLDPQMAAARFQIFDMHRRAAAPPDQLARDLADFQRVQALQKTWVIPEDVEWSNYAEIYEPLTPKFTLTGASYIGTKLAATVDAATAGTTLIDTTGTGQTDLLSWSSKGIVIFSRGQQLVEHTGLEALTGVLFVAPGDFDNDGLMDLCVLTTKGPALYRNTGGKFVPQPAKLPGRRFDTAVWLDYDHDYDLDLVLLGPEPALLRNQGAAGWEDHTADFPFIKGNAIAAQKLRVDLDSKAFDLAVFYSDHAPVLYRDLLDGHYKVDSYDGQPPPHNPKRERGESSRRSTHYIRIQLKGIRSLKLAQDAFVEVKAGTLYQRQAYEGVPLTFDVGDHATVDVVRITWPNGLIQNEVKRPADRTHVIEEAQRLSGSCPMIWCWNGSEFQFITDVLGVAPLGARDGDGSFFPVNHEEYVQIPGAALREHNGRYEVRVTEELSEVSYLDQIQLYAVDHPAGNEIFTNQKFQAPPFPPLELFTTKRRIYPRAAHDDRGNDVLPLVTSKDQRYPADFERSKTGLAAIHTLDLDFASAAPEGSALLLLNGWVDWPDGSTFLRASQESKNGFVTPYLQVQDAAGTWKTINADMGMPAGKPKTIVVPVRFLSASRKVRIVTNLCVYWDEIFLSDEASTPITKLLLPLEAADLHFRGFSESRVDAQRKQPDTFFYSRITPSSFWNPTPGLYTKFGAVESLLRNVDDQPVIMGSGEEVRLQFRTAPPPPAGWRRDFLLKVDGWAKDRDPNTAFSATVQPLPFHAMSRYPYPATEHYPRDAAHDAYQRTWNTRPAQPQITPLD